MSISEINLTLELAQRYLKRKYPEVPERLFRGVELSMFKSSDLIKIIAVLYDFNNYILELNHQILTKKFET